MLKRKIFRMKDSRLITLPSQLCEALGLEVGDFMNVELDDKKLILTPTKPTKAQAGAAMIYRNKKGKFVTKEQYINELQYVADKIKKEMDNNLAFQTWEGTYGSL